MKLLAILLLLTCSYLKAETKSESPTKEASAVYRTKLSTTKALSVYEGLPHQLWDEELLAKEIKRNDITKIGDFPFYTPNALATNSDELKLILSSSNSIEGYKGPALCGGYHPDYCLSWESEGRTYYALICFGCHEIVFYDEKEPLIYDLETTAFTRLKALLSIYDKKRPRKPKG
jgi:hypothetical protein